MILLKNEQQIEGIYQSGKILSKILQILTKRAKPGASLIDLDNLGYNLIKKANAKPAFLGYKSLPYSKPFPGALCFSLNEEIVHGIPRSRTLVNGDVLKIDGGVNYKGFISDAALTLGIGRISLQGKRLIKIVKKALDLAIKEVKPGKHLGDIGYIIENTIKKAGFSVVKGLTGHGVGFSLHEEPTVLNYGQRGKGIELKSGMVLALEPMACLGKGDIEEKEDGTIITSDGSLSAHFEKTIAVVRRGAKILTPYQYRI